MREETASCEQEKCVKFYDRAKFVIDYKTYVLVGDWFVTDHQPVRYYNKHRRYIAIQKVF